MARLLLAAHVAVLVLPASASAAPIFGDKDVRDPTLAVNAKGVALVTYTTAGGATRHVLAWGAINAIPHPTDPPSTQQQLKLDYSGGWKSQKNARYWHGTQAPPKGYPSDKPNGNGLEATFDQILGGDNHCSQERPS